MGARWQEKKTKSQSQGLIKDATSSRLRNASVRLHPENSGSPLPPGKCLLRLQDMFKCKPSVKSSPGPPAYAFCLYSTGLCHYYNTCATDTKPSFLHSSLSHWTQQSLSMCPESHSTPHAQHFAQGFEWI